jgi:iron complex outermembrane receptor protein
MYLDGVYIARSTGAVLDLLEVQSIEVLKGPQGTLFGKNTIGGAISIVSRKPDDEFEAKLSVGVGRFSRTNLRGFVNIPVSDTFAMNAAISSKKADGFVKNRNDHPDSPDIGDENSLSGRVAFRWTPSDSVTVDVSVDATKERENNTSNVHLANYETAFLPLVYNGVLGIPVTRFGFTPDAACADFSSVKTHKPHLLQQSVDCFSRRPVSHLESI